MALGSSSRSAGPADSFSPPPTCAPLLRHCPLWSPAPPAPLTAPPATGAPPASPVRASPRQSAEPSPRTQVVANSTFMEARSLCAAPISQASPPRAHPAARPIGKKPRRKPAAGPPPAAQVQLAGSPDKAPARVVAVAHETDLALVETDTGFEGPLPHIRPATPPYLTDPSTDPPPHGPPCTPPPRRGGADAAGRRLRAAAAEG